MILPGKAVRGAHFTGEWAKENPDPPSVGGVPGQGWERSRDRYGQVGDTSPG